VEISTILGLRPRAWLIANATVVLVAMALMTLTVAALEIKSGIAPTNEDAAAWTLSGE
jgi:hypothetical protein